MVWGLRFRVSDLNLLKSLAWTYGSFPKLGVPYFGVLIIRLLLRVLYSGPLFSETPI